MMVSTSGPAPTTPSPPVVSPTTASVEHVSAPPSRRRNRLPIYIGAAAVAVGVLVVLASGIFVDLGGSDPADSSDSTPTALSYLQAAPKASASVTGSTGPTWTPVMVAGYAIPNEVSLPLAEVASVQDCTFTPGAGFTDSFIVPGYPGDRSGGLAPFWFFMERSDAGEYAYALVQNGEGTVLGTFAGSCTSFFDFADGIPSGVIDSSTAASAVSSHAVSFLSSYPDASSAHLLMGGNSFGAPMSQGPSWQIMHTTCSLDPTASGNGVQFNAIVDATNGQLTGYQTTSSSCGTGGSTPEPAPDPTPTTTPLGAAFEFHYNPPTMNGASGLYTTSITIEYAHSGVTWSDFSAVLYHASCNSTRLPVPTGWSLTAQNLTGTMIATCDVATGVWVVPGAQLPVASGDRMVLTTTFDPRHEYFLMLTGMGSFSGELMLFL